MQLQVGVVTEDNAGHKTSVCSDEADRYACVEEGLIEDDHVVISGRSVDGRE